jgi:hypothetical protein
MGVVSIDVDDIFFLGVWQAPMAYAREVGIGTLWSLVDKRELLNFEIWRGTMKLGNWKVKYIKDIEC